MRKICFTNESVKINWFNSGKYFVTDESVKKQITGSISENLTDSDLESTPAFFNITISIANSPSRETISFRTSKQGSFIFSRVMQIESMGAIDLFVLS